MGWMNVNGESDLQLEKKKYNKIVIDNCNNTDN